MYVFDDNPARIDHDVVWAFLSTEAYWARWRTRADVEASLTGSWRVVGCYLETGPMVGFARAVSDGVNFAYLADVFIVDAHRGRGLGTGLIREMIDNGPGRDFRWTLFTNDAHDLYRKFGFVEPDGTALARPSRRG